MSVEEARQIRQCLQRNNRVLGIIERRRCINMHSSERNLDESNLFCLTSRKSDGAIFNSANCWSQLREKLPNYRGLHRSCQVLCSSSSPFTFQNDLDLALTRSNSLWAYLVKLERKNVHGENMQEERRLLWEPHNTRIMIQYWPLTLYRRREALLSASKKSK